MIFPEMPGVYDHLIVHCSATPPSLDVGASWIDRVHRRKGYSGGGYHIVITRSGDIQWSGTGHRTRKIGKPGAHVGGCGPGWNQRCLGVVMIGGVKEDGKTPEENFTDEQWTALLTVIHDAQLAFGIETEKVMGHRDLIKLTNAAPKACPCFSVQELLDGHLIPLDVYDEERLSYDWDRKLRPAPQRGEKLVIKRTHIVKKGETLWSISRLLGVPLRDIRRLNQVDGDMIKPGQKLLLRN